MKDVTSSSISHILKNGEYYKHPVYVLNVLSGAQQKIKNLEVILKAIYNKGQIYSYKEVPIIVGRYFQYIKGEITPYMMKTYIEAYRPEEPLETLDNYEYRHIMTKEFLPPAGIDFDVISFYKDTNVYCSLVMSYIFLELYEMAGIDEKGKEVNMAEKTLSSLV